jgi:hypothetical protein
MSAPPFLRYKDVLVNDHSASAKCLRSIVLSMRGPYRYAVAADELGQLSPEHFDAAQALLSVYKKGLDKDPEAGDVLREIEQRWPDYRKVPYGLYPFPAPETVFVPDQADLIEHLQPFFGIDLNVVNREWSGYLTMLGPLEPTEHKFVGQATEDTPWHSMLLHTNWIGFKVEEGRYRLMGDPRYFFLHADNEQLGDPYEGARESLLALYADQKAAYEAAKKLYHDSGRLFFPSALAERVPLYDVEPMTFVEQIGGVADFSKFPNSSLSLSYVESEKNGVTAGYPRSPAGRLFHHVASVPAHHYQSWGADLIMMFYEPVEQLVLFTFYWEASEDEGRAGY